MTLAIEARVPDRVISSLVVGEQEFYGVGRSTGELTRFKLIDLTEKRGGEAVLEGPSGRKIVTNAEGLRRRGMAGEYWVTAVTAPIWVPIVLGETPHPNMENPQDCRERISIASVDFSELRPGNRYVLRFKGLTERTTFDTEAILNNKGPHSVEFKIDDTADYTIQRGQITRNPNNLGVTIYPQQVENPEALIFVQSGRLVSSLR